VRAGLGPGWTCLFANDIDPKKAAAYRRNWDGAALFEGDVREAGPHLPAVAADLAWASFPCQDLSLAGGGAGLEGARSGAFWPFWGHMQALRRSGRAPRLIALENVTGALSTHGGRDFAAIVEALQALGYDVGALVIDAALFVPQSRPRLFFLGVERGCAAAAALRGETAQPEWTPPALLRAHARLAPALQEHWVWWRMAPPPSRNTRFADLIETEPTGTGWHAPQETQRLLDLMAPLHREKLAQAAREAVRKVGAVYRRTRPTPEGARVQRAEVRFDDVAGCLRTPAGGSSRQALLIVEGGLIRSRLLSPRETARLMGLPDSYLLPERANDAYHLTGDGVAVPVVKHLSEQLLLPLLAGAQGGRVAA
jgi:DNA (cytosine-5)-methyltransferase 1